MATLDLLEGYDYYSMYVAVGVGEVFYDHIAEGVLSFFRELEAMIDKENG